MDREVLHQQRKKTLDLFFSRRLSVHSRDQFRNLHLKGNPYLYPRWSIRGGPKLNANLSFKTKPFYCVHRIKKASASFSNCLSGLKKPNLNVVNDQMQMLLHTRSKVSKKKGKPE